MKKVIGVAVLSTLISTSAWAVDMAVKPPPPASPPAWSWTGFYVGGNAGYAWTEGQTFPLTATQSVAPLAGAGPLTSQFNGVYPLTSNLRQSGAVGGIQGGYNWQFDSWVTGVEADFDYSSATGASVTASCCGPGNNAATTDIARRLDAFGTLRVRFGFATDRTLYYVTGGLAVGESTLAYAASITNVLGSLGSASNTPTAWQAGWTLGAGVEYAVWQHWTVKVEYLYYDLGTQSTTIASNVPAIAGESWTATTTVRNNGQIVRGGINYKF
jgi:outer membrane immunogenic protein